MERAIESALGLRLAALDPARPFGEDLDTLIREAKAVLAERISGRGR